MDEKELSDLENPDSWDDNSIEVHQPVKDPRAVVSVGFAPDDFRLVSKYAKAHGKKVSVFIREAALDQIKGESQAQQSGQITISTGQGGYINRNFTAAGVVQVVSCKQTINRA